MWGGWGWGIHMISAQGKGMVGGCDYMSVPYRTVPYQGKIQYRTVGSISEFTEECR